MDDIYANSITILRILYESGCVRSKSMTLTQLGDMAFLNFEQVQEAISLLSQSEYIGGGGWSPEGFRWITLNGIEYLKHVLENRYPLSLTAEKILEYLVTKVTREMEWGVSIEIMKELDITLDQYNSACQVLLDFELITGIETYNDETLIDQITATPEGRRAYRRNFRDPAFNHHPNETRNINTNQYFEGDVESGGGDVIGQNIVIAINSKTVEQIFYSIENSPYSEVEKVDLHDEFQDILSEVKKGDKANESFIARRLRNIRRMAPEIFEVIIATMINPAMGFGMVAKKVAEKIKVETS